MSVQARKVRTSTRMPSAVTFSIVGSSVWVRFTIEGGKFIRYSEQLEFDTSGSSSLAAELRTAVRKNQFELHYQPKVDLKRRTAVGVEALLRWENPRAGADADFVPLAEVAGLAVPLGHWTLRAACRQANLWHKAGHQSLVVSVNVSERHLHHPALLKLVRRVLDETSLPPACLELEISESEIRPEPERTIEQLARLRELTPFITLVVMVMAQ